MSQTVYHDFPTASGNSGSNSSDGAGSGIGNITTSAVNIVAMSHTIRIHKIYETTVNANIVLLDRKKCFVLVRLLVQYPDMFGGYTSRRFIFK